MKSNYDYRKDGRTDKQFKKDIKTRTKREKVLTVPWAKRFLRTSKLESQGKANNGKVIKGFHSDGGVDFYIVSKKGKKTPLQIKVSPSYLVTLKKYDLDKIIENKVKTLIFVNTNMRGDDLKPSETTAWFYLDPIWFKENASFDEKGHPGFGGKPTYRMYAINEKVKLKKLF